MDDTPVTVIWSMFWGCVWLLVFCALEVMDARKRNRKK